MDKQDYYYFKASMVQEAALALFALGLYDGKAIQNLQIAIDGLQKGLGKMSFFLARKNVDMNTATIKVHVKNYGLKETWDKSVREKAEEYPQAIRETLIAELIHL